MLDIAPSEFLLVAFIALVVIGPKDLPKAMRIVGYWVGRARAVGRQFRSGFDEMVREAELAEMEKKWKEENERIMREHPAVRSEPEALPAPDGALPAPAEQVVADADPSANAPDGEPRMVENASGDVVPEPPVAEPQVVEPHGDEQPPVSVERPHVIPAEPPLPARDDPRRKPGASEMRRAVAAADSKAAS